jgi:hydrogenase maturation factor
MATMLVPFVLKLTKGVGIEAVAILLSDRTPQVAHLFGGSLDSVKTIARRFGDMLSVVPEARLAVQSLPEGAVSSMHDPTEGGLAGALHEVGNVVLEKDVCWREKSGN